MVIEYYPEPYIHTRGGRFYLDNPTFDAESIGHALGMLCRFNGNTSIFYSVAEHSILVSEIMRKVVGGDPFEGLMHDAAEAYLSDIPTPFKRLLPDWARFEEKVEGPLRKWAHLPVLKSPECEHADKLALFIESFYLIPGAGEDFLDPLNVRGQALAMIESKKWQLCCWEPRQAGYHWITQYHAMGGKASAA
jgi:uncharacterized protein